MIVHDVAQGSPEWFALRAPIPTASEFDRIVTPKTGSLSSQREGFKNELIAAWLTGEMKEMASTAMMERGSEMENEARIWYSLHRDVDPQTIGFVTTDDGRVGCSPDSFAFDDGGVEIKCPAAHTHVGYLLGGDPTKYRLQIQGSLWICEKAWWDWVSYHPTIEPVCVRIERDEEFIELIADAVTTFCDELDAAKASLMDRGMKPFEPELVGAENGEGIW